MDSDFPAIERDFLDHCHADLVTFQGIGGYGEQTLKNVHPEYSLQKKLLRLMYNGAKSEDPYCLELIRYLYKTYHRQEYNRLKRFREVTPADLVSLTRDDITACVSTPDIGRILSMCTFLGIDIHTDCSVLYLMLEDMRQDKLYDVDEDERPLQLDDDLFQECLQEVENWDQDYHSRKKRDLAGYAREYGYMSSFAGSCLSYLGYDEEYINACVNNNTSMIKRMAIALTVLRQNYPARDYTYEDVLRYTAVFDIVIALVSVSNSYDKQTDYLLHQMNDLDSDVSSCRFNPGKIRVKKAVPGTQTVKRPPCP